MERYNEALEKMKPVDLNKVSNDDKLVRSRLRRNTTSRARSGRSTSLHGRAIVSAVGRQEGCLLSDSTATFVVTCSSRLRFKWWPR